MYDYADEQGHNLTPTKSLQPDGLKFWNQRKKNRQKFISQAYHKAKADGSNPELVKAVEDLLGKPTEQPKETIPNVETKKADIERRIQEEKRLSNKQFISSVGVLNPFEFVIPFK